MRQVIIIVLSMITAIALYELVRRQWQSSGDVPLTAQHDLIVEKVSRMGKLELVRYQLKDIVEIAPSEVSVLESILLSQGLYEHSRALLIITGEAVGCIDLRKIKKEDIVENDSTIIMHLPKPEICYVKVDHRRSRVYDVNVGWLSSLEKTKLIEAGYRSAEEKIEEAARESRLLEQTKESAEIVLRPFLEQLTHKRVVFTFEDLEGSTVPDR
ncbi:MAG: hypothetical protein KatS3mg033_1036 [Thermonema sp.]|uniref:DUF4230 domain-containing protein n=1 Tax=Thermonema sp. TaxID=2231181 RepID=UPI0021DE4A7C|nr:DUF4230 domain-containing protein [Thermonema sp.]GIV39236.1 MAG: hypothetical protein KatS3mg033_1036 [Thermonema sp.]